VIKQKTGLVPNQRRNYRYWWI